MVTMTATTTTADGVDGARRRNKWGGGNAAANAKWQPAAANDDERRRQQMANGDSKCKCVDNAQQQMSMPATAQRRQPPANAAQTIIIK